MPLLICSDDIDFVCTVVVAEQEVTTNKVFWRRFGFAFDHPGDQVGASVKWFEANFAAEFDRSEVEQAIIEFKRLTKLITALLKSMIEMAQ